MMAVLPCSLLRHPDQGPIRLPGSRIRWGGPFRFPGLGRSTFPCPAGQGRRFPALGLSAGLPQRPPAEALESFQASESDKTLLAAVEREKVAFL